MINLYETIYMIKFFYILYINLTIEVLFLIFRKLVLKVLLFELALIITKKEIMAFLCIKKHHHDLIIITNLTRPEKFLKSILVVNKNTFVKFL